MEENKNAAERTEPEAEEYKDENVPIPEVPNLRPETLNPQPTDMEVHHHAHAGHGKKNWKSYFWEFLMLFFAVFCGFLAEYKLEHVIEHNREKEYMRSMIEDLKTDSTQLGIYIGWRKEVNQDFDSIRILLKKPDRNNYAYDIYMLSNRTFLRFGLPDISESTIGQLKNAGGLRLIRNVGVSNAINRHYLSVNRMKSFFETERLVRLRLIDSKGEVLDASLFRTANEPFIEKASFKLFSEDRDKINRFLNNVNTAMTVNRMFINQLDSTKNKSIELSKLIQNEYHME